MLGKTVQPQAEAQPRDARSPRSGDGTDGSRSDVHAWTVHTYDPGTHFTTEGWHNVTIVAVPPGDMYGPGSGGVVRILSIESC